MNTIVSSHNDWDPLLECFVGVATNARFPTMDRSTHSFVFTTEQLKDVQHLEGPVDPRIVEEANEDLNNLADTLTKLGVRVRRPNPLDHAKQFSTPDWTTTGYQTYSCRDLLLPLNNIIIESASPMRSRRFETMAYRDYLLEAMQGGTEWIATPQPQLLDKIFQQENLAEPSTRNLEVVWDAANVVRLGRDLLYQVSNSGTDLGFTWLQRTLEPRGYTMHKADRFYAFAHFDSTVLPLRPGLVLFNGARCTPDHYPGIFKTWDKIFFDPNDIVDQPCALPNAVSTTSPYIGLNFLSINESLVICDRKQTHLRRILSQHGIDTIGLEMRHAKALSGGFHCVTLDVKRQGNLESYF